MLQQQETTIHDLQATRDAQANTLKDLEDKLDREVAELQAGRDSQANVLQSVQAEQLAQTTVIQGLQTAVDEQNSTLQQHASTLQTQQTLHLMNEAKQSQQDVSIQAVQASCDVQVSAIDKLHGQVNGQGILMLDLRNNQSIIQEQLDHVATWMKKQAAFFVDLKSPFSAADVDVGHRTPIKFNHVLLNIGDNYNSSTGVFTAPFDGVYLFTLHIYAMSGGDRTETPADGGKPFSGLMVRND
nr:hypothetical protein BaRGS_011445 [Batillaria attramentaria]